MTRRWIGAALVAGMSLTGPAAARAEVRLTIADGQVTLDAKDATVRQILDEWARVGQTKFVNVERLTGAPMTLQLSEVPEARALDILLRSVSGYLLAPRPTAVANASQFDRILVMPTSTPPRANAAPAASTPSPFQQPQLPAGFPPPDDLDDDLLPGPPGSNPRLGPGGFPGFPGGAPAFPGGPPVFPGGPTGPAGNPAGRGPVTPQPAAPFPVPNAQAPAGAFPPPGAAFPSGGGAFPPPGGGLPTAAPAGIMPVGVAVPGMVVQPPAQAAPPTQFEPQ